MVNFGQTMNARRKNVKEIQQVGYRPPGEYPLDVEVFSVAELKRRVDIAHFRAAHRIEFYLLICITHGQCIHTVDFKPIDCKAGTVLMLRPAQAQQFDAESDWDGWLVIFRPEFLLPSQLAGNIADIKLAVDLDALPDVMAVDREQSKTLAGAITQMHSDAMLQVPAKDLHNLLRHQLYSLLLRLQIFHGQRESKGKRAANSIVRFKRFQQLVEKNFAKWHQVSDYAKVIGCSEKSLTRAVSEVTGNAAKSYIASRINLEAKRLLAHTALPIGLISDRVGFEEATNFVKFFKREVGCSPGEFRRRHEGSLRS
jgi:AraC-like DNA-binding protein